MQKQKEVKGLFWVLHTDFLIRFFASLRMTKIKQILRFAESRFFIRWMIASLRSQILRNSRNDELGALDSAIHRIAIEVMAVWLLYL